MAKPGFESRVHALNQLAALLEDTSSHQDNEKEPEVWERVREGEIVQAEGKASAKALKWGRPWLFQRKKEAAVAEW